MSIYKSSSLAMIPTAYKDGKLYSVRPNDGDGDFTFSRGSNLAATRVDVNGLIEKGRENLVLQSNQFDTTWTMNANASVTSGQGGYDGTNDAWLLSTNGSQYSSARQTIATSGVVTASFYAKANTLDFIVVSINGNAASYQFFDLANGAVGTNLYGNEVDAAIVSVGNGWYRCSLTFNDNNIVSARAYPVGADNTFTTTAGSIYIQDAQLEAGLVATDYIETTSSTAQAGILEDMPRLDYSGGASCPALLLEPQRSNVLPYSEYFNGWTQLNTISADNSATSPEGVQNAAKLVASSGYSNKVIYQGITANTYTASVFAKKGELEGLVIATGTKGAFFNLDTQSFRADYSAPVTSYNIEDFGNGWHRYSITFTEASGNNLYIGPNDNTSTSLAMTGDGTSGIYIYGATLEAGSYPTSYIPTYGASVTRSLDSCVATSVSDFIGQEQGTLFVEFTIDNSAITGANRIFSATDGTISNRILLLSNSAESMRFYLASGGSVIFDQNYSSILNGPHKVALGYSGTNLVGYMDGVKLFETTSSYNIPATTNLYLGTIETGSSGAGMEGSAKQAAVFKTRLTNAELAALTTL